MSYTATGIKPHGFHRAPGAGTFRKAGRAVRTAVRTAVRRQIAKRTSLRVLSVVAGFGIALLPKWLRWIPAALLAIPGPADELAFVTVVLIVIAVLPDGVLQSQGRIARRDFIIHFRESA